MNRLKEVCYKIAWHDTVWREGAEDEPQMYDGWTAKLALCDVQELETALYILYEVSNEF
jgi:hypothetical protein